MFKYFDKTFFKTVTGFIVILGLSFLVFYVTNRIKELHPDEPVCCTASQVQK